MKKILTTITMVTLLAMAGCNNGNEQKSEAVEEAAATAPVESVAPAFVPFDVMQINLAVKDYNQWRPGFDNDSAARKASGLEFLVVGRMEDNPNNLSIYFQAAEVAKAKEFAADPRLKELMDKNGVQSKPEISYFHVLRFDDTSKEKQWVVITHRVKDFEEWLKVYDSEGPAKRLDQGMVDVVLARGVDDPSLVLLVFDIKDMAKAKAAIASDEKRNLMMSAGVEGEPKIGFYTSAD